MTTITKNRRWTCLDCGAVHLLDDDPLEGRCECFADRTSTVAHDAEPIGLIIVAPFSATDAEAQDKAWGALAR